eukprot:1884218-Alexandrium_andersonii.AAC.1
MSASLVGSEMCIRDSARMRARSHAQACIHARAHAARTHARTHASTREPVSYTHLTLPTICSV